MVDYLFPHFLSTPREYEQAESIWQQRWQDLLRRVGQEGQWQTPWVNTNFANGTPCRDGNPIFSAVSPSRRLAVRIVQLEPADDAMEFHVWKDSFAEVSPEAVEELVISCVLTQETLTKAVELMRQWITEGKISRPPGGPMRFLLLHCIAKAVVKHGIKFLCNLAPGGGAVYDFALDVLEDYRRAGRENALPAELQAVAQAPAEQVQQQVEDEVKVEAAGQPDEVQQALTAYLTQVPAAIRRSLRRPSDSKGTTVPATLTLSRPEDLMAFLPPRPPRFRPGDRPLPAVDLELEELVGVGGFGEVWKALHIHMRSEGPVALKFCLDSDAVKALRNEVGVLDRVRQHGRYPGIVPLRHTYLSANPPCLEYEYVEGGDLASLIQDLHSQGRLTLDLANDLFLQLVEIVAHAHRADPPIVHGDLKPANVLVRRGADGKFSLHVTDFGIGGIAAAQASQETRHPTRSRQELLTEAVRGAYTPVYASPEQMMRQRGEPPDPRDDVHALGVIWYQLLTGELRLMSIPPDWHEQVKERGLSEDFIKLLSSCITRAAKRLVSAVALAEQLGRLLKKPPSANRIEPLQPQPVTVAAGSSAALVVPPPPTSRPDFRTMFWEELVEYLDRNGHSWAKGRKPTEGKYIRFPVGQKKGLPTVSFAKGARIRVELFFPKDPDKQLLNAIEAHRYEIEKRFSGEAVNWERERGNTSAVAVYYDDYDKEKAARDPEYRKELYSWIEIKLTEFRAVAQQYLS
jgi:serine/threonine protein kinase